MRTDRKKRNPQDATLRNVRAAKKREASVEARVRRIEIVVGVLMAAVEALAREQAPAPKRRTR